MDFAALQGILPSQMIRRLLDLGHVFGAFPEHIKEASLELAISDEIYRMKGSYTPRSGERIRSLVREGGMYQADIKHPLEQGVTYLVRLHETVVLPEGVRAECAPLFSILIAGVTTRLLSDGSEICNTVAKNYAGELWLEITPTLFPIQLQTGDRLCEIFFTPPSLKRASTKNLISIHTQKPILTGDSGNPHFPQFSTTSSLSLSGDLASDKNKTLDLSSGGIWIISKPEEMQRLFYRKRESSSSIMLHEGDHLLLKMKEHLMVPQGYVAKSTKGPMIIHPGTSLPSLFPVKSTRTNAILRESDALTSAIFFPLHPTPSSS